MTYDEMIALTRRLASQGRLEDARRIGQAAAEMRRGALARAPGAGSDPRAERPPTGLLGRRHGTATAENIPVPQSAGGVGPQPGRVASASSMGDIPADMAARMGALLTREGQAARRAAEAPAWSQAGQAALGAGVRPFLADGTPNPAFARTPAYEAAHGNAGAVSGETLAAVLNNAGEAMTFNLVGDEAAARLDSWLGRGSYDDRLARYQGQERRLEEQYPNLALAAELGGSLVVPGQAAARFINRGVGTLSRMRRGAGVAGGTGAVAGAMDPQEGQSRTAGAAWGALEGAAGGAVLTGLGQGFLRAAEALRGRPEAATLAGLKDTASRLYEAAEAAGDVVDPGRLRSLGLQLRMALQREGYHPRLHPRLGAVLKEIDGMARAMQPLERLEQLRRIAGNAAESLQPDERRLGGVVIDRIDSLVDTLDGSEPLRAAREVWGRMRRLERVERIFDKAGNADADRFESTLVSGFRALLNDPRRMRGFNAAERRAMQQIARGSVGVRALRTLADAFSLSTFRGMAGTAGVAYGGLGPAALALPAAASAAGAGARALVRSQAEGVRRMVGRDDAQRALEEAWLMRENPLAPLATGPGVNALAGYFGPR